MSTILSEPPIAAPVPVVLKRKRVLLVDGSRTKRELRAEVMRKLGMDVDCAADIPEARCWWRAQLYDLVLLNVERQGGHRDRFCEDVRSVTPPQALAFLVGKPEYLADSPNGFDDSAVELSNQQLSMLGAQVRRADDREVPGQRWGIMEASLRISAVRSASVARTQAMRNLPAPARDSEGRLSKRNSIPATLDDLLREEMQ
jgi:hypothetical protein